MPLDLCAFLYMDVQRYLQKQCMYVSYSMLCNKLFQNNSLGHSYDLTVTLGQECRRGFRGSPGSPWVSHKATVIQGSARQGLHPSSLLWLMAEFRSLQVVGWRTPLLLNYMPGPPSVLYPAGLSEEHLTA